MTDATSQMGAEISISVSTELKDGMLHIATDIGSARITDPLDRTIKTVTRSVIDLQDAAVRRVLIDLGWTPPPACSVPSLVPERASQNALKG